MSAPRMDGQEQIDFYVFTHARITPERFMKLLHLKEVEQQHAMANNEARDDIPIKILCEPPENLNNCG